MIEIDFGALLLSLCLTLLLYGAYPLLSANKRDTEITKKKYFWKCYGINFLIWLGCFIFEELTYGRGSSGGAYILWTWVFESVGKNKLRERGLLIEGKSADTKKEKQKSAEQSPAKANTFSPQFTQTRSAATESYKEQFIRTMMADTGFPEFICEETFGINSTFFLYGKTAGIERMYKMENAILSVTNLQAIGRLTVMYSYICGYMVPLGHLTKAESDQMSKAFAEKMQNVLLNSLNT